MLGLRSRRAHTTEESGISREIGMKRKIQKLRLTRETLCSMEQNQLEVVAGGVTAIANCSDIITSCDGCNTRNTCTSRYC
jgi:hypothetical protein